MSKMDLFMSNAYSVSVQLNELNRKICFFVLARLTPTNVVRCALDYVAMLNILTYIFDMFNDNDTTIRDTFCLVFFN